MIARRENGDSSAIIAKVDVTQNPYLGGEPHALLVLEFALCIFSTWLEQHGLCLFVRCVAAQAACALVTPRRFRALDLPDNFPMLDQSATA